MSPDFAAIGAAVLYAGGVVVLFGVRSWQQQRATGRTGFNAARSRDRWARLGGAGLAIAVAVRNPIFTAMVAAQLGTALVAPTWLSVLGVVALIVGCQLPVRLVEEPHLARVHGGPYTAYARRVGRFLPGLGRLPDRQPGHPVAAGPGLGGRP